MGIRTVGFQPGTRVYVTLPGGKREGFTFRPKVVNQTWNAFLGYRYYYPYFEQDLGVTTTLTVPGAEYTASLSSGNTSGNASNLLMFNSNGDVVNAAGLLYNPADSWFGGKYLLKTSEGMVYEIDGATGDLNTVTDPNGNKLTYTDSAITSSTGQKITFGRDAQGRITTVTDPMGQLLIPM